MGSTWTAGIPEERQGGQGTSSGKARQTGNRDEEPDAGPCCQPPCALSHITHQATAPPNQKATENCQPAGPHPTSGPSSGPDRGARTRSPSQNGRPLRDVPLPVLVL